MSRFQHATLYQEREPGGKKAIKIQNGAGPPREIRGDREPGADEFRSFYDIPANVPAQPGMLIRSAPLAGVLIPQGAKAWRILYTTTLDDQTSAVAPASNMLDILTMHDGDNSGKVLGSYVATSHSQFYPDVIFNEIVRPQALDIATQNAKLCRFGPDADTANQLNLSLDGPVLVDPISGAFG
jgi:hypothetical protein